MKTNKGIVPITIILILLVIVSSAIYYEKNKKLIPLPVIKNNCATYGCFNEGCGDPAVNPEYFKYCDRSAALPSLDIICYKKTKCERQTDGKCGWTQTQEFKQCKYEINKPISVSTTETNLNSVTEGQEFTINFGEKVMIADSYGATFKLTGFDDTPCPPTAACIFDVFYELYIPTVKYNGVIGQQEKLYIKDKTHQNTADMPYSPIIKGSDYKTFVKMILLRQGQIN